MKKKISSCGTFALVLAGLSLACNLLPVSATLQAATSTPATSPSGPTPTSPSDARLKSFAEYPSIPVNLPATFSGG